MSQDEANTPQWVAGDPVQSAMFHKARACAAKIGAAKNSKILWAGNAILFVGSALLSTPEGASLVVSSVDLSDPFGMITSLLAGYAGARAIHQAIAQRAARKEMDSALSGVIASAGDILPQAQAIEGADPKRETYAAVIALGRRQLKAALEKARQGDAKPKPRGPK